MGGSVTAAGGDTSREQAGRPVRADARRNLQVLTESAKAVFAASGVDAPMHEIAERAGMGVGTIYRHFPKRADLIVAVFRREVDACADSAASLAADYPIDEALHLWVERYTDLIATKRGLAAALHSGDPAYEGLPDYFEDRLSPALGGLLQAAAAKGHLRADADAGDLLWAFASLCVPTRTSSPARTRRMIELLIDGLHTRRP